MQRRTFLKAGFALPALSQIPGLALAQQLPFDPKPGPWRTYELVTRVELARASGESRVWIPLPSVDGDYQQTATDAWSGNAARAAVATDGKYGARMLFAQYAAGEGEPWIEVTSRFSTRDRAIDLRARGATALNSAERRFYTEPTSLLPTDGIVRDTAREATKGARTELDKARAIYNWIVENTFRDPKTEGCGRGDVKFMLESGNLGGKCADLNSLFVALARAAGLPSRDIYGLRVAKSRFGYRSLGAGTENVTRAQHCRAEVFVTGIGWIPVDPADVRKVVLEEKAQPVTLADPLVPPVREKLFGAWEMNWLAYNEAHDVKLPGSAGAPVAFLMYPHAETGGRRVSPYAPDDFKYRITAREIT